MQGLDGYRCLMAATLATGITVGAAGAAKAEDRPDITIAVNSFPRTLSPGEHFSAPETRVYDGIYDSLIRRDFNNPLPGGGARLVPALAESWSWITQRTLEVKLRQDVVCHDGNPFNADDVLATFSPGRLYGPEPYYPHGPEYYEMLGDVEKVDDYTVRFILKSDDPVFEHKLSNFYTISHIICDETWNAHRKPGVEDAIWMDEASKATRWNPVGTGPYKFVSALTNDHVTLAANDAYWGGKPTAATLTFRTVPEVAARVAGIISGDYDLAVQIPPDQWDFLSGYSDVTLKTVPMELSQVLVFNQDDPLVGDKDLRQALSYSIDRKALSDALWKGQAVVPFGHQPPAYGDMYVTEREGKGYPYDLEKAKELLAKSSYKGEEIAFRVVPNYYPYDVQTAEALQEMWRKIGINVRIDFFESFEAMRTPGVGIYFWQNVYRIPDPTGQMTKQWGPGTLVQDTFGFFNASDEFNELSHKISTTFDLEERQKDWGRMLDILEDDMPFTVLYMPPEGYALRKSINWAPYSQYALDFRPSNFSIAK